MGFSVRIAPGVRVRASSRGMRASVGPRIARVHVGGGRAGVSTGVGPFGYYTSIGGGRSSSGGRSGYGAGYGGPSASEINYQRRLEESRSAQDAIDAVHAVQMQNFTVMQRPIAPLPQVPDRDQVLRHMIASMTSGLGFFAFGARRRARAAAKAGLEANLEQIHASADRDRARLQASYDEWWESFVTGDPETVLPFLNHALSDNAQRSAAVHSAEGEATVTFIAPSLDDVPSRKTATTPTGLPTTKAMTKSERAQLHKDLVLGHLLVTAKEVAAVAPWTRRIRVVSYVWDDSISYEQEQSHYAPLVAAVVDADRLRTFTMWDLPASAIIGNMAPEVATREVRGHLAPLDVREHPDLLALNEAIEHVDAAEFDSQ